MSYTKISINIIRNQNWIEVYNKILLSIQKQNQAKFFL